MCSVILSANRRPVFPMKMIRHCLHIMPYTIVLEMQVYFSVTLKVILGPFMCVAEQLERKFSGITMSAGISTSVGKH